MGMVVSRRFLSISFNAKAELITWEVLCPVYFLEWQLEEDGEEGRENHDWLIFFCIVMDPAQLS